MIRRLFIKLYAFLYRDFKIELSYPLAFIFQLWGIFFQLVLYFFLARTFSSAVSPFLAPYGGDYFPFVIIGIAFSGFVYQGMHSFAGMISSQQQTGTLEAQLVTQTSLPMLLLGSSLWQYVFTSFRIILYLLAGMLIFGLKISLGGIIPALIILILGIISSMAIGILSAAFIVVYKRGNPLNFFIGGASTLFGGVYFPISVLPHWLQGISYIFPLYYCLDGLRLSLIKGASIIQIWPQIFGLILFCIILLPLSLYVFELAVRKAKREGTLAHY